MIGLEELRQDNALINEIDWEMTPEKAVSLYLEWGSGWRHNEYVVKSKNDVAFYFVVYAWDDPPVIFLVRRNMEDAEELATIELPEELKEKFLEDSGRHKGVYALTTDIKDWLQKELDVSIH